MPAGPVIARVAGAIALIGLTLGAQSPAVKPLVDKDHRRMQPEAATFTGTTINIVGDPSQPGIYVVRRLFKSGEITTTTAPEKARSSSRSSAWGR